MIRKYVSELFHDIKENTLTLEQVNELIENILSDNKKRAALWIDELPLDEAIVKIWKLLIDDDFLIQY